MKLSTITASDWGPTIKASAYRFAAVCAAVYTAGFIFGSWLHDANDRLARAYVTMLGLPPSLTSRTPTKARPLPAGPAIQTDATVSEPVAVAYVDALTADLSSLKMTELRKLAQLAGVPRSTYRTARKAELLAMLEV